MRPLYQIDLVTAKVVQRLVASPFIESQRRRSIVNAVLFVTFFYLGFIRKWKAVQSTELRRSGLIPYWRVGLLRQLRLCIVECTHRAGTALADRQPSLCVRNSPKPDADAAPKARVHRCPVRRDALPHPAAAASSEVDRSRQRRRPSAGVPHQPDLVAPLPAVRRPWAAAAAHRVVALSACEGCGF
jgi:hypothetical protein